MRAAIRPSGRSGWRSDRAASSDPVLGSIGLGSPSSSIERDVPRIGKRHRRPRPAGDRRHVAHARQPPVLLEAAQLTDRRRCRSRAATGERDADIELRAVRPAPSRSGAVFAGVVSFQNVGLISQNRASTQLAAAVAPRRTAPASTAPTSNERRRRLIARRLLQIDVDAEERPDAVRTVAEGVVDASSRRRCGRGLARAEAARG